MAGFDATTRWRDANNTDIEEIIAALEDISYENSEGSRITYKNFRTVKTFDGNQVAEIDGKEYVYNHITYSYDSITPGATPVEDRTQGNNGFVIVYFDGVKINYIINRNNDALRILRMLLGYTGRNEIVANSEKFDDDFFMWLIKKVFSEENIIDVPKQNNSVKNLIIDSIIGVRGETRHMINKVSAEGDTVMNLISTLSFILESGALKQIVLRLGYEEHENLEIKFNDKNVIAVDVGSYSGVYENDAREKKQSLIFLLVYLDILPKLIQSYEIEKDFDLWNNQVREEFFDLVSEELITKVKEVKEKRKNTPSPDPLPAQV